MSTTEIPLLRESAAFAARLLAAAARFGEGRYHLHRRVNWSHRYAADFYAGEARCFAEAPQAYLAGRAAEPGPLPDVYRQRLRARQVAVVLAKVLAHWLFALVGRAADRGIRQRGTRTYRKAYVDDIELVFDPEEAGVVRAVYPFPINALRQWRYLRFLRRTGHAFKLAGHAYRPLDLMRFLWRRDVRTLMRLEARAQLLHARQVLALGVTRVQLSDEFDIGSLDFTRALARRPVRVVNSAHGVGKYLPMHAYQAFHVLTQRQVEYYHATRPCHYAMRPLNQRGGGPAPRAGDAAADERVRLVFLGQTFAGSGQLIAENEAVALERLRRGLAEVPGVVLHYKPHPNRHRSGAPAGFRLLADLAEVNGRAGTVFASFFSTCQIDPAFQGRKVLLRGRLIHPEIAFDDSETILTVDELIGELIAQSRRACAPPAAAARAGAGRLASSPATSAP
ncbi:MAG: hypothetical protein JNL85_01965 [Rubrivivax sp.]|nr:hypothetical protein [Rubrivivax sp.]